MGRAVEGDFGRVTPQPVFGGKPGRSGEVVLGRGVIGIVREVPKVERSGSLHDYEITGAP